MPEVDRQLIDSASMNMINMVASGRSELFDYVNFARDDLPPSRMLDPLQRTVAYMTPADLDPLIRRVFFPPSGKAAAVAGLIQEAATAEASELVPVVPEDIAVPFAN
jgi:hypothetical protein